MRLNFTVKAHKSNEIAKRNDFGAKLQNLLFTERH